MIHDVHTNLDPETLTEVVAETYRMWLAFALGQGEIGGKTLAHPSGRYAASISYRKTGAASFAVIADESVAPEALWIEDGRRGANMKDAMLAGGKIGKDGCRYRDIPIRKDGVAPGFDLGDAVTNGREGRLPAKVGRLWATPRAHTDAGRYVRMSDAPGSSAWQIPDMPAYSPAAILADLIGRSAALLGG